MALSATGRPLVTPTWIQTPNARLVYRPFEGAVSEFVRWKNEAFRQSLILERDLVKQGPWQLADAKAHLYAFRPYEQTPTFWKGPFWVAREVIGPPHEDIEDFQLYDLDRAKAMRFGPFVHEGSELLVELFSTQTERASTWRIEWDLRSSTGSWWVDLFPENAS